MIRNRKIYRILVTVTLILLTVLTFMVDPLRENYSMLSGSTGGYLFVMMLTVLLGAVMAEVTHMLNRRFFFVALFGPLLSAVFPYVQGKGDLYSGLHEILAYVSFAATVFITLLNIWRYSFYDYKRGRVMMTAFIIILFIDAVLFLETMGAVAIEQFILLSAVVSVHYLLFRSYNRE